MEGLVFIERVLLELISEKSPNFEELKMEMKLPERVLKGLLKRFLQSGHILKKGEQFIINKTVLNEFMNQMNHPDNLKEEFREIFDAFLDLTPSLSTKKTNILGDVGIHFKKISLTLYEQTILENLNQNIKNFLEKISKEKREKGPKTEEQIIFWGGASTGLVMEKILPEGIR